jgi:HAD superfamily hydrolase (TIGR01458 family)
VVTAAPADVVVLGGAGPAFTYDRLNEAFSLVVDGAPLVAMHRNLAWQTTDGLALDTGGFLAAIELAAGVDATVTGKPAEAFFAAGATALGLAPDRIAMVGDDVVSDVQGAQKAGMVGVLVRTGKFRPEILDGLDPPPDLVVDSFADVPHLVIGAR